MNANDIRPGFWNCCQARPAKAVLFINDETGAPVWYEACNSCASGVAAERVTELPNPVVCIACGFNTSVAAAPHRCRRVTRKTITVNDIRVGDTLVVQDAIIRADGTHFGTVIAIRELKYERVVTMVNGKAETTDVRYRRRSEVNLGITF